MRLLVLAMVLLLFGLACAPTVAPQATPKPATPSKPAGGERDKLLAAGKAFFEANKLNDELRRLEFKLSTGGFEDADVATFRSTAGQFEQQLATLTAADVPANLGQQLQAAGAARLKAVQWLADAARRGSLVDTSTQPAKDWLASQSSWDTARGSLLVALSERGISAADVGYAEKR